jgi:hypothetical protein
VEIKPHKQTIEPTIGRKKKTTVLYEKVMWENNKDKWKYAREYARKHGMEFIIITDKDLG